MGHLGQLLHDDCFPQTPRFFQGGIFRSNLECTTDLCGVEDVEDLGGELWPVGLGLVLLRKHLDVPQLPEVEIPLLSP